MNKLKERLGFVLEVNIFFFAGVLASRGHYYVGAALLLIGIVVALWVGEKIKESIKGGSS